jgi:hypothetical protein
MRYWAHFKGRLIGAIGIFYLHTRMCQGANPDEATRDLYTTHEHISDVTLYHVADGSRAKPGDVIEPLMQASWGEEQPTGITYQVLGRQIIQGQPEDVLVKNSLGHETTLPKEWLFVYRSTPAYSRD